MFQALLQRDLVVSRGQIFDGIADPLARHLIYDQSPKSQPSSSRAQKGK